MNASFHNRHFITEDDWSKDDLDTVFEASFDLKRKFARGEPHRLLPDKTLFMIFFEQSTPTT
jgi:ornithine carbamoyltransferase